MNILLICNKKNILGNKLIIYTTLYCNSDVNWIICLTEDIEEREQRNIQNLVSYLDSLSSVIFERIDTTKSLEDQFDYLSDFLYISADCMVAQTIEYMYQDLVDSNCRLKVTETESRYCTFFISLKKNREKNKKTYIVLNDGIITALMHEETDIEYFEPRIGYCGKFSFNFNMPILFWFDGDNLKVYEANLRDWYEMYPDFKSYIEQIQLAETIYF